jgi:hypothetical protein
MSAEELGHAEGLDLLLAEDRLHHLVGGEPLLVLRVLGSKKSYEQMIFKLKMPSFGNRWMILFNLIYELTDVFEK